MIDVYKMCADVNLRSDFADVMENFRKYFRFAWRLNMVNATVKLHTVYAPWHLGNHCGRSHVLPLIINNL